MLWTGFPLCRCLDPTHIKSSRRNGTISKAIFLYHSTHINPHRTYTEGSLTQTLVLKIDLANAIKHTSGQKYFGVFCQLFALAGVQCCLASQLPSQLSLPANVQNFIHKDTGLGVPAHPQTNVRWLFKTPEALESRISSYKTNNTSFQSPSTPRYFVQSWPFNQKK